MSKIINKAFIKILFLIFFVSLGSLSQELANYEVQRGETLWSIADRYQITGLTVGQTANLIYQNNLHAFEGDITNLIIGSRLLIPLSEEIGQEFLVENNDLLEEIDLLEEELLVLNNELDEINENIFYVEQEFKNLEFSYQELEVNYQDLLSEFDEINELRNSELANKDMNPILNQEIKDNVDRLELLIELILAPFFLIGLGIGLFLSSVLYIMMPNSHSQLNVSEGHSSNNINNENEGLDLEAGVNMQLDLAQAYIDMGDIDKALAVLEKVLVEGDLSQKKVAKKLIDSL
tara:strand:- start:76 stop:948 length:873 start_codon:yes stop_codon:yes gene_type:complete